MKILNKLVLVAIVFVGMFGGAWAQKLSYVKLIDGVKIKLPSDFGVMSDDDVAIKYPSTKKPLAMYTNIDRNVDFGLNVSKTRWPANDLNLLFKVYKATIMEMYTKVEMIKEGVVTINNQQYIAFEYNSQYDIHKRYNYIIYKIVKEHVYIFSFSCPTKLQDLWQPKAHLIMESLKFDLKHPIEVKIDKKEGVKYYQPKKVVKKK